MDLVAGSATPSRRGFLLGSAVLGAAASAIPTAAAVASAAEGDASADLVLSGARGLRTGPITGHRFSMVGMTWRGGPGAADLRIRTRRARRVVGLAGRCDRCTTGRTGAWRASRPAGHRARVDEPRDAIDVRGAASGRPDADPVPDRYGRRPGLRSPRRAWSMARTPRPDRDIVARAEWGADEKWRDGSPWFNRTIQQVHVHHTVNSNDYAEDDVPALLRGIYRYHTKNLGWSDIGYNFLVDRFGRIWTGRAGGAARPVRGAHTLGFNATSTGVAVIGNFEQVAPSTHGPGGDRAGWRRGSSTLYGREPSGTATVVSEGSDKFAAGQ